MGPGVTGAELDARALEDLLRALHGPHAPTDVLDAVADELPLGGLELPR